MVYPFFLNLTIFDPGNLDGLHILGAVCVCVCVCLGIKRLQSASVKYCLPYP